MRRADEMERKLKFLESEIKKDGIRMNDSGDSPDAPPPREMSDLESTFEKLEQELQEVHSLLGGPRGVMDRASACGASSPGFDSHDILFVFISSLE